MATALDILSLQRMKRELEIPPAVGDHDVLLQEQIVAAVDFCDRLTGLGVADLDAGDVPASFVQGSVIVTRWLYDGIQNMRETSSFYHLLRPLRRAVVLTA